MRENERENRRPDEMGGIEIHEWVLVIEYLVPCEEWEWGEEEYEEDAACWEECNLEWVYITHPSNEWSYDSEYCSPWECLDREYCRANIGGNGTIDIVIENHYTECSRKVKKKYDRNAEKRRCKWESEIADHGKWCKEDEWSLPSDHPFKIMSPERKYDNRKIQHCPDCPKVYQWKSDEAKVRLRYPRHHECRCPKCTCEEDNPWDLMVSERILHDFSHPFPGSFSIIVLVSLRFSERYDESEWDEEHSELQIERCPETQYCEESSEKTRECLRNSSDCLHPSRYALVLIESSELYKCIIEHGGVRSREKARSESESEFCEEKSPEPRSETVDAES